MNVEHHQVAVSPQTNDLSRVSVCRLHVLSSTPTINHSTQKLILPSHEGWKADFLPNIVVVKFCLADKLDKFDCQLNGIFICTVYTSVVNKDSGTPVLQF